MESSQAQQLSNLRCRVELEIYMRLLTSTSIFIISPSLHCHKSPKRLLTTYKTAISASNPANSAAGKVVLITGTGSGIGQAAAASFAIAGAKALILIGRRTEPLTKTAAIVSQKGPDVQVRLHGDDISDANALKSVMDETGSTFGQIDIVIHAAGVLPALGPISTMPVEELWKALEVNIKGALNVAQSLLATGTSEKRAGSKPVLVTLNTAGMLMPPIPGMGGYVVSKAVLPKLVEYLAAENPDKLRTVTVHPGLIRTPMAVELEEAGLKFPYDDVSLPADFLVWVTSPEASFLNGKFVFANWDVEELKARKAEIENGTDLRLVLSGLSGDR
ncbi:short chain dehydrogenase [Colletotrichum simmondsii]|uniref:Short chain dehydrogenase n=1 Tax=Colletotrichum simmondsii TaxID=703756 RepID=A0A135T4K1_9PEZI|nr:short chain dehydrogenase [Colletotrichum simmondsii]